MRARRAVLLAMACAVLAACATARAREAPTHRCIEIPNGLAACEAIDGTG